MTSFSLNPRLEGDSFHVLDLDLSMVRLMKDANYPWLLLVPRKNDLIELIDLDPTDQHGLMDEIAAASAALKSVTGAEKLNVAALGNQVSQLHIHVIARFRDDAAWPGPVWGAAHPQDYEPDAAHHLIERLRNAFAA